MDSKQLKRQGTTIFLLAILIISGCMIQLCTINAVGDWLNDWTYRQALTIPSAVGSGSGFYNYNVTAFTNSTYYDLYQNAISCMLSDKVLVNGYETVVPISTSPYNIPYCWDQYFIILGLLKFNTTLAQSTIDGSLSVQNTTAGSFYGMIPNAPSSSADQDMRSQTPLIADAVWTYYLATGNLTDLARWYPALEKYYSWYNITGTPTGSIAWLTSPAGARRASDVYDAFFTVGTTGMDNTPTYDATLGTTKKIGDFYYLNSSDLMLSSAMSMFAINLANMSSTLGLTSNQTIYNTEALARQNAINAYFWDSSKLSYAERVSWTGTKDTVQSQVSFISMIGKGVSSGNATSLMTHYNSAEFKLTYGMPTIAANDSKYYAVQPAWMYSSDTTYWRGNSWAYTTYLAYKGMKNYGFNTEASDVATKWINMVNLEIAILFAEVYDSRTGVGKTASPGTYNYAPAAAVTIIFILEEGFLNVPGLSSGSSIFVDNHVDADFSDIRFYIGSTPLYYYPIVVNSYAVTFWFKVPDALAGQPVYIYYGNPGVGWDSTYKSGANTFLFFDDFAGASLNTTKWNWSTSGGQTYSVNNKLIIYGTTSGVWAAISTATYKPPINSTTVAEVSMVSIPGMASSMTYLMAFGAVAARSPVNTPDNCHFLGYHKDTLKWDYNTYSGGWGVDVLFGSAYVATAHYQVSASLFASSTSNYTIYMNSSLIGGVYNDIRAPLNFAGNYYYSVNNRFANTTCYYVFTRPQISAEQPSSSWTWGVEEIYTVPSVTSDDSKLSVSYNVNGTYTVASSFWFTVHFPGGMLLSGYILENNMSGSAVNSTWQAFSQTNNSWAVYPFMISMSNAGDIFALRFYANSSTNVWGASSYFYSSSPANRPETLALALIISLIFVPLGLITLGVLVKRRR